MTGTEMIDDELGDAYYDACRSDEDVYTTGLRAVADAADRAAVRRVLDELETLVDTETENYRAYVHGVTLYEWIRERREAASSDE